jgi:hypothetical protein
MVLAVFHASTGSMNQLAGAWGEDNTADQLRRARRRRLIWGWVNNGDEFDRQTAQQILAALRRFKERARPEYVLD